jgi:hypothetical protein
VRAEAPDISLTMIFFSGLGFLVAPIVIASFIAAAVLEGWVKSRFGASFSALVFTTVVTAISAAGILGLDKLLVARGPVERVKDTSGNVVEIPCTHTFMFLQLKWFAYAWIGVMFGFFLLTKVS